MFLDKLSDLLKKLGRRGPAERQIAPAKVRQQLREWYAYGLGEKLAEAEHEKLSEVLPGLFGYFLVQVGYLCDPSYLNVNYVKNKLMVDLDRNSETSINFLTAPESLALSSDSVDVVILPHVLEFSDEPHEILREAERVLVPEGHLIIIGFNPWSLWGVKRMLLSRRASAPWCGKFISPTRIKDWLALLGFAQNSVSTFFFKPPVSNESLLGSLNFMDKLGEKLWPAFGGVYMFVAKKRVSTLTQIRPSWKKPRRVLAPGLIETRQ